MKEQLSTKIDLFSMETDEFSIEQLPEGSALGTFSTASSATTASCPFSSAGSIMTANCAG